MAARSIGQGTSRRALRSNEEHGGIDAKVATVIGARPHFIKASAVSHEIGRRNDVSEILIHTGQHNDDAVSKVFFDELGILPPKHNLQIGSASRAVATARMLERLEPNLQEEEPDCVVVYGDTNSTVAGALVAKKLLLPRSSFEARDRGPKVGRLGERLAEPMIRLVGEPLGDLAVIAGKVRMLVDAPLDPAERFLAKAPGSDSEQIEGRD